MNQQNHSVNSLQLQTIPARVHTFLVDKIKECVDIENKGRQQGERELTVADFMRIAAAERVGRILKEDVSDIPPVIRGRGGSLVAQLAKKLGMSRQQLEAKAAELLAAQAFGLPPDADDTMRRIISGELPVIGGNTRAASKSGEHRVSGRHAGPGLRQARRA